MTTRIETRRRSEKVKQLILQGYTVPRIANKICVAPHTVRTILEVLEHKGLIVRVPNSNPAVYHDPHAHPILETLTNDPMDVFNRGEPIQDYLPEGMPCPPGFVNVHIDGYVKGKVRKKGRFDNIIRDGKPLGIWTEPESGGKGQTKWTFKIHLFGQNLKFVYYESTHGTMQARFYLKRIYVDPKRVPKARRREYFLERGEYFTKVLGLLDWQITDLEIVGKFHYGKEGDTLSSYIPRDKDDGDIVTDTSPGIVETEMENLDEQPEDVAEQKLIDYSNIPSAMAEIRNDIKANRSDIEALIEANKQQQILLAEMQTTVNLQNSIISTLIQNVTGLTQASVQLTTIKLSDIQKDVNSKLTTTLEGYN